MDPKIWGEGGWHLLHRLAHTPGTFSDVKQAREFYTTLGQVLPCKSCRENFKGHLSRLPFPKRLSDLARWMYSIHSRVNAHLGGEHVENVPSFAEVRMKFAHNEQKPQKELIFIRAIAKTHPGKFKATPEYIAALRVFLQIAAPQVPDAAIYSRRQLVAHTN